MNVTEFKKLLNDFKSIPASDKRNTTFLEISGYPYRETVYSNIFRFFFNSEELHELGNLFISSLLNILGKDSNEQTSSVVTEVGTDDGKRIDIVVETSSYLIGIENKVFSGVDNPFASYSKYLQHRSNDESNLEVLKIILCLSDTGTKDIPEKILYGFTTVTYERLFTEIKKNIGEHIIQAQSKYLTLLFDFIETIENSKEDSNMNQEFIDFIKAEEDSIQQLSAELDKFRKELRHKTSTLGSGITINKNTNQWYYKERNSLFDTLVHDIEFKDGSKIGVDTSIDVNGWVIEIFNRKGFTTNKIKEILADVGIEVNSNTSDKKLPFAKEFDYEAEKQVDLRNALQDILDKLSAKAS